MLKVLKFREKKRKEKKAERENRVSHGSSVGVLMHVCACILDRGENRRRSRLSSSTRNEEAAQGASRAARVVTFVFVFIFSSFSETRGKERENECGNLTEDLPRSPPLSLSLNRARKYTKA